MNAFSGLIPSALSRSSSIKLVNIRDNYIGGVLPTWVGGLSQLRILLLKGNNLHGHIPIELCQLKNLSLLDLSYNNLSGSLPPCINNLSFGRSVILDGEYVIDDSSAEHLTPGEIIVAEFITKSNKYFYKGDILNYMSGIDLSCNHLTGEIPVEMGQLNGLHSLNLSHNQFTGPKPITFKNLSQIESLDLSFNRLNGTIPSELTQLTYLEIFSVAHNNLSGRTPDMKSQFATFSASSYDGNALLCGAPLNKSCISTTPTIPAPEVEEEKDDNDDNLVSFYASFVGSYFVFLLGTILVLYFTSQRRAMCFFHVVDSWTRRVVKLDLSCTRLLKGVSGDWYLNASLLLPFRELQSLNLSQNSMRGLIDGEALKRLSKLSKLQELELRFNNLNETILPYVIALQSLKMLDVGLNKFKGPLPIVVAFLTICLELICHATSLSGRHSLNLSYNLFAGTIPVTFEKLSQIESLDLSYNRLNGTISFELTKLNYLSFFSVAHNNLSGKTPDMKFQFATFNGSSYDGNPLLCGPPLNKSCISTTHTIQAPKEEEEDDGDDGLVSFFASFIGSYLVFLLGTVVVLYFISQRRAVFFLHSVDSWCAFRLYQVSKFFGYK
ncbi:hypothetical protein MRB53_009191 [Persea americana]|uniref:Uncharacterized protein n=1 Tax=Persea americana TaxID=3435 RepID=A0ACC2LNC1_PERAE|nr:hypothetical protein MRB53_009191 [Persea americana]